jgi:hypothetical protein
MQERFRLFISRENITLKKLLNPFFVLHLLIKTKYLHFFLSGISGVVLQLAFTWFFTEFIFGQARYFDAYLFGLAIALMYLFALHTFITFRTKQGHPKRFLWFFLYSLCMSALQAFLVKVITPIVGIQYYLVVIAGIILMFSTVSFLFFKLALFKE